jgi:hypothetical protein
MRLFCLHQGFYKGVDLRLEYLKKSCDSRGVTFVALDSLLCNYTNLPSIVKGDLIYNCARGSEALETILLNENSTSFYIKNPPFIVDNPDTTKYIPAQVSGGVRAPKTIFHLTNDRVLLENYVSYLGGFPIIIKNKGGTMGVGTIKVETWHSLLSIVDYLITTSGNFILREFIENTGTARLVVLGDKVIATEFRDNLANDFRVSPIGNEINYYSSDFDKETCDLAISATKLSNFETAGVDVIFDKFGKPYVLEVNFPHNFLAPQNVTGVDISGLMVEFLIEKANKLPL